jgi:hypothetical protein
MNIIFFFSALISACNGQHIMGKKPENIVGTKSPLANIFEAKKLSILSLYHLPRFGSPAWEKSIPPPPTPVGVTPSEREPWTQVPPILIYGISNVDSTRRPGKFWRGAGISNSEIYR